MEYLAKYRPISSVAMDFILNILLVYHGGRQATLLETANLASDNPDGRSVDPDLVTQDMANLVIQLGLQMTVQDNDAFPRWIVARKRLTLRDTSEISDEQLAKLLGMFAIPNDRWYSPEVIRIAGTITAIPIGADDREKNDVDLYAEVHERAVISRNAFLSSLIQKTEHWNPILRKYGYECAYELKEDRSTEGERLEAVRNGDYNYIIAHLDNYKNDVWNTLDLPGGETLDTSELWHLFQRLNPATWQDDLAVLQPMYENAIVF